VDLKFKPDSSGLVPGTHENSVSNSRAAFMGGRDNSPAMTKKIETALAS